MATAKKAAKKPAKKPAAKKAPAKKPAAKKAPAKKAPAKKAPAKKPAAKKSAAKRKPNAAFMKPMTPSCGARRRCRLDADAPHRRHQEDLGLHQEEQAAGRHQRRLINADEKLRAVFGGKKQVSMFEMTKLVSNHLK